MLYWFVLIHVPWPGELIRPINDDIRAAELGSSGSFAGSWRFQMLSDAKRPLAPDGGCAAQQLPPVAGLLPAAGDGCGATAAGDGGCGAAGALRMRRSFAASRRRHTLSAR